MKYVKPEIISLKAHAEYNEKWLQGKIEEDPSIIGLGDLIFKGSERQQTGGGRLDTLLYDPEDNRRYEVEIQLGKTDESHIIRTIEYWDLERKKNPQYEHCAVIIAEDITSRFLNVISLFNGFIPLIAIQVKALKLDDNISLFFTKVLDELRLDRNEDDVEKENVDRNYWENKSSKKSLEIIDKLIIEFNEIFSGYKPKYNKHYIGLGKDNIAQNFISFIPRKNSIIFQAKVDKSDEIDSILSNSDLDLMTYDKQWRLYRIRLIEDDLKNNLNSLKEITRRAFEEYKR